MSPLLYDDRWYVSWVRIVCVVNYRRDLAQDPIDNKYQHSDRYCLDNVRHMHVNTHHSLTGIFSYKPNAKLVIIVRFWMRQYSDIYLWHPRQSHTYNQFTSISSSVLTATGSVLITGWTGCGTAGLVGLEFCDTWLDIAWFCACACCCDCCCAGTFTDCCCKGFCITYIPTN